jgi:hypothetical protein
MAYPLPDGILNALGDRSQNTALQRPLSWATHIFPQGDLFIQSQVSQDCQTPSVAPNHPGGVP